MTEQGGTTSEILFDPILVDHAVRCLDAERENASRLSSRANFLLTAVAAIFALGLYRIDWFRGEKDLCRIHSTSAVWTIKGFLIAGLLSIGWSFIQNIGRPGKRVAKLPHSSNLLSFPASVITDGPPVGDDARRLVFVRVYKTYLDLQERNAVKRRSQDRSQRYIIIGFVLIGLAILTYIISSSPPG